MAENPLPNAASEREVIVATRTIVVDSSEASPQQRTFAEFAADLLPHWRAACVAALLAGGVGAFMLWPRGTELYEFLIKPPAVVVNEGQPPTPADFARMLNSVTHDDSATEDQFAGVSGEAKSTPNSSLVSLAVSVPQAAGRTGARTYAEFVLKRANESLSPMLQASKSQLSGQISSLEASIHDAEVIMSTKAGTLQQSEAISLLSQTAALRVQRSNAIATRDATVGMDLVTQGKEITRDGRITLLLALALAAFASGVAAAVALNFWTQIRAASLARVGRA